MTIMAQRKQHCKKDTNTWKVPQEVAKDESSLKSVTHDDLTISKQDSSGYAGGAA